MLEWGFAGGCAARKTPSYHSVSLAGRGQSPVALPTENAILDLMDQGIKNTLVAAYDRRASERDQREIPDWKAKERDRFLATPDRPFFFLLTWLRS